MADANRQVDLVLEQAEQSLPRSDYLTLAQVAAHLGCSAQTVRRMIKSNKLTGLEMPRGLRVPRVSLLDHLRRKTIAAIDNQQLDFPTAQFGDRHER